MMHRHHSCTLWFIFCLVLTVSARGEEPPTQNTQKSFNDMSIEELLNIPTAVATKRAQAVRAVPSVVTIVTGEEIRSMGARNLVDVLMRVPGLDFGSDVEGVTGIGVRGQWAFEGKVLVLIDGLELNEGLFGVVPLGDYIPVEHIARIEIIRGPGSVIYGGSAELGVVNIITNGNDELKGAAVSGIYGQGLKDYVRRNASVQYANQFGKFQVSAATKFGQVQYSDREYKDSSGAGFNFRKNSSEKPVYLNLGVGYDDWQFRYVFTEHLTTDRTAYGVNLSRPVPLEFRYHLTNIKKKFEISKSLRLLTELSYKRQQAYESLDPVGYEVAGVVYQKTAQKLKAGVTVDYSISENLRNLSGLEFYKEFAFNYLGNFGNGSRQIEFSNTSAFSEFDLKTNLADFNFGIRYEYHSHYQSSVVPRLGLVKLIDPWHIKLLYSRAFRAPVIENLSTNAGIQPERTGVAEAEVGVKATEDVLFTLSLFDIRTDNPIVYNYSAGDSYKNFSRVGTMGFEFETKWKRNWGNVSANYSYYRVNDNRVSYYNVPGESNYLLAFPAHKVTLSSRIELFNELSVNPSLIYFGHRFGYATDSSNSLALTRFPEQVLANMFIYQKNALTKNLDVGLGVYNLFNTNRVYVQPYNGSHSPLPGDEREIAVKADYRLEF